MGQVRSGQETSATFTRAGGGGAGMGASGHGWGKQQHLISPCSSRPLPHTGRSRGQALGTGRKGLPTSGGCSGGLFLLFLLVDALSSHNSGRGPLGAQRGQVVVC